MTFIVVSEHEKIACVGNEVDPAIDIETNGRITIPADANGYKVTKIGTRAFAQCKHVEEIEIPEGVKSIDAQAFAWCAELKSVTIPSTVTDFGLWIFLECRRLQSVYSAIHSPLPVSLVTFSVNSPPLQGNGTDDLAPDELYNFATLYVPTRCKEKYQEADGWNLFRYNIVEAEPKIDGLRYALRKDYTAMVANDNQWEGELDIPEQVTFNGEVYTVNSLEWLAFRSCETLTKVRIPKTIASIEHYAGWEDCKNPFANCTALASIEVDEENPWMCSADGVLFNKEKTRLYCYPSGATRESYNIPESVEWIGMSAFSHNPYLTDVYMPNSVTRMCGSAFSGCKRLSSIRLPESLGYIDAYTFENCENLHFLEIPAKVGGFAESVFRWSPIKTLIIRGTFSEELRKDTFYSMDDEVVVYVQKTEVEKLQKVFSGTILPLEEYDASDMNRPTTYADEPSNTYDLTGRPAAEHPAKGIYIRDGRKVVVW
ncbi:MAG: leucine-rich repeat domain-containing protein [Bacteroidaceae bacterium]|nr:leucine-rich repeat domain-containing protein [Bacteroidaceae bacterium]